MSERRCSRAAEEMAPASTGTRSRQQGRRTGAGEEALPHQKPQYLLGYAFKFISCQFTLESQPENVHAALIMTMTATITSYLYSLLPVHMHFCQPCGVGLIISISQARKAEVRGGDISLSKISSLLGDKDVSGDFDSALYNAQRLHSTLLCVVPEGLPWSLDYRKHIACTLLSPTLKTASLDWSSPIQNFCT